MKTQVLKLLGGALLLALVSGCAAVGATAGGAAGYALGCKEDNSREECAAATGGGAIGGAVIGGALD